MATAGQLIDKFKYAAEADALKIAHQTFGSSLQSPFIVAAKTALLAWLEQNQSATQGESVAYLEGKADSLIKATIVHYGVFGAVIAAFLESQIPTVVPQLVSEVFTTIENQALGSATAGTVAASSGG